MPANRRKTKSTSQKDMSNLRRKTVSFRFAPEFESALRTQAAKRGMMLNAYVVDSLRVGLEWGPVYEKFDFLHIGKRTLVALLEHIEDKDLLAIAYETAPRLKELSHALYGAANFDAFRQLMGLFAKYQYSWPTSYTHYANEHTEHFVIRHGICRRWSIFLSELFKTYLEQLGFEAKYEVTNDATILTVIKKTTEPQKTPTI